MEDILRYGSAFVLLTLINFLFWKFWNLKKINFLRSIVKSDRWGTQRVPLTGGVVVAVLVVSFLLYTILRFRLSSPFLISVVGAAAMFFLGLVDYIFELKSYQKLLGQIIVSFFRC